MRLLVIGGSDAGISAGLRARELDPSVEVTLLVADRFPNFSICGLPYYLSGEVSDWRDLAHRHLAQLQDAGLRLLLEHTAQVIDPAASQVIITNQHGQQQDLTYDQLIIATGATPARPPIPGLDLPGVHVLHTMADTFALHQAITQPHTPTTPGRAVIIGGGYIGLEAAEALVARDLAVTLVEQAPAVLPTVDPDLGQLLDAELARNGVKVHTSTTVTGIDHDTASLVVHGDPNLREPADLVLVAAGVQPNSWLAAAAGIQTGVRHAIRVSRHLRTNLPGILAAGDCVETYHRLLEQPSYLPLGTTAHKQGRIAGENAIGGDHVFAGSLGTQVVKVFDLAAARTGLRHHEAAEAGLDPVTVASIQPDRTTYYPGVHRLHMRWTAQRTSGQLLGVQLVGHRDAEVAKRIDTAATALHHHMTVEAINDLDLSYAPPFATPWDAIQLGAQAWVVSTRTPDR
jgi:NADPH-dependent 2,4-dienoyl-CoA reductase/sulfur reductase-like enzyme